MNNMLDFYDLTHELEEYLHDLRREEDGLLHCSSDLVGSLRHAQLRIGGSPTFESKLLSEIRMATGTFWHASFRDIFSRRGFSVLTEFDVTEGLPGGWSGTADWLIYRDVFYLWDLKTCKGEAIPYRKQNGPEESHVWQISAYLLALQNMNFPVAPTPYIYYLPMNDVPKHTWGPGGTIEPVLCEVEPIDSTHLYEVMDERCRAVGRYVKALELGENWVNEALAAPSDRVQELYWNGKMKVFDLKLKPQWYTQFCMYPDELCDCNTQKTNKIGHYTLEGEYISRKNYEDIEPTIEPTEEMYESQIARDSNKAKSLKSQNRL